MPKVRCQSGSKSVLSKWKHKILPQTTHSKTTRSAS